MGAPTDGITMFAFTFTTALPVVESFVNLKVDRNGLPFGFGCDADLECFAPLPNQLPHTRLAKPTGSGTWAKEVTTMMVSHVPRKHSLRLFACELDAAGFSNQYDFIYLPMKSPCQCCKGFAFVNFVSAQAAWEFHRLFHNKRPRYFVTAKPLVVRPAEVQGFEANVEKHLGDEVKNPNAPMIFRPLAARLARGASIRPVAHGPEAGAQRMAVSFASLCSTESCRRCGNEVYLQHSCCGICGFQLGAVRFMSV